MTDFDEWLDPAKAKNDGERAFIAALANRAQAWHVIGLLPIDVMTVQIDNTLVIGVDVSNDERTCILRTLRIDFDGKRVLCGEDETGQFCSALDPLKAQFVNELDAETSMDVLATTAAEWMEREVVAIDRHA
jgi:hypothetical protein